MDVDPDRWDHLSAVYERRTDGHTGGSGCLRVLAIAGLVLLVLAFAGGLVLSNLHFGDNTPVAVVAQVRTAAKSVELTPSTPKVSGHIRVTYDRMDQNADDLALGVSLGLPEFEASVGASQSDAETPGPSRSAGPGAASPRLLFTDPLVRLTSGGRSDTTCAGPCEIELNPDNCAAACVMDFHFALSLVAGTDPSAVKVPLTATASASPGSLLPDGLAIELTLDGVPVANGG